tara:strand:- start:314 stop:631 length:318 start_codon:yes stop_codon:yes gene_type:complete
MSCNYCGCCGSRLSNTSNTFNGQDGWGATPAKATFDNFNGSGISNRGLIAGFYNNAKKIAYYTINGVVYQGNKPTYFQISGESKYMLPSKHPDAVMTACYKCICC